MKDIPCWVKLGENVHLGEHVVLGLGNEELGDLVIGDNAVIGAGSVIYRGVVIGRNFTLGYNSTIRERNKIGDNVSIGNCCNLARLGNEIGDYCSIKDGSFLEMTTLGRYVFVAPNVTFLDDMLPIDPSLENYGGAVVGDDVAIGGASVIRPGVQIASNVLIACGSVVLADVPAGEVWAGNPAKKIRMVEGIKYPGTNTQYLPGTRRRWEKNEQHK